MNRRAFLNGATAALVVAMAGGTWLAWEKGVFSTGSGPAYEPWKSWNTDAESGPMAGPLVLVKAAVLASNAHNIQPWLFRVTETEIELLANPDRNHGQMDPFRREMYTGLGCALENLLLAARARGYDYRLTLTAHEGSTSVARVELLPGSPAPSELYDAIPRRHTNRGRYDTSRPVSAELMGEMAALAGKDEPARLFWYSSEAERGRVGDLLLKATEAINTDPSQADDSSAWERYDWQEIQRSRDGITLDAQALPAWQRAMGKVLPPLPVEKTRAMWLKSMKEKQIPTASALGIIAVPKALAHVDQVQGGRFWQRLHLWATAKGLAMQPLNQLTERADRERDKGLEPTFGNALRDLLGEPGWEALLSFRVGYPTEEALPSPRRSLEQVML